MTYHPYQLKESRWQQSFANTYTVLYGERHGTITIPGSFSAKYIRFEFSTWDIPKTWYLAGWLNQYYSNDIYSGQLLESFKIPINVPKIIEVNDFARNCQLTFKPIERILSFRIFIDSLNL